MGPAVALKILAVKQFAKLVNSPLLQDGVGGKLCTQSFKGIEAIPCPQKENKKQGSQLLKQGNGK